MGLVAVCMLSLISCSKDDSTEPAKPTQQIHYTLASKAEGEVELMSNEHYFNSLGQADIDMVLLMSVNPGFGGQKFIESTIDKVKRQKQMINEKGAKTLIEVDGGVQGETAPRLAAAGVDVLVSGSYVFGAKDPHEVIKALKALS